MNKGRSFRKSFLYSLSFIEGGVVMSTELAGAKLLAPYFGTSLYVWACVMALTLGGLAGGYFLGGRLSVKKNHETILMISVLCAAIYISCLPMLSFLFLYLASNFSLLPSVLISSAFVLFPPIFIMGMVSPLIIKSITTSHEESGKKSGEIYAISTMGGICFTFLTAFYLIPQWGITITFIVDAILLAAFSVIYFIKRKAFFPVLFLLVGIFLSFKTMLKPSSSVYLREGLLGKLEVVDKADTGNAMCRFLLVNNVVQSCVDVKTKQSKLQYSDILEKNLSIITPNAKTALVLGLGGGVISNMLIKKNIDVTAVELDNRIAEVAATYFNLSDKVNIIEDDARHALYQLQNRYDVIVMDMFNGEVASSHVLSLEFFTKLKTMLSPDGFIFVNTYGFLTSKAAKGNLILLNTLQQAGFNYKICYSGNLAIEDYRTLLLFASVNKMEQNLYAALPEQSISLNNVSVSTDDKPTIEFANAEAGKRWRYSYFKNSILLKND
jgi:predicted membrane-bound spermidine synthase